jgi:hypothetical protein
MDDKNKLNELRRRQTASLLDGNLCCPVLITIDKATPCFFEQMIFKI